MENITKTELELAQELIAKAEAENQQKAITLFNEAIATIGEMGYIIESKGQFQGNKFEVGLVLVKKCNETN